ncbi:MAG: hypothetical protein U0325_00275 [Polyangiales bacterium]
MARAWAHLDALRRRLNDLDARLGDGAVGATAAAMVRTTETPQILEAAGFSEEPFASRLSAYQDAVSDGGVGVEARAQFFAEEDAERLHLMDALDAIGRPAAPLRTDAGR